MGGPPGNDTGKGEGLGVRPRGLGPYRQVFVDPQDRLGVFSGKIVTTATRGGRRVCLKGRAGVSKWQYERSPGPDQPR